MRHKVEWEQTYITCWQHERLDRNDCWSQWEQTRIQSMALLGQWPSAAITRRRRLISQLSLIMQHQASVYPSNKSIIGGVRLLFHEKTKNRIIIIYENLDGNGEMRVEWWWGFDIASVALEMFQMSLQPHLRNIQLRPCQYEMHTTEWRGKFWQDLYFAWESWRWNKLLRL